MTLRKRLFWTAKEPLLPCKTYAFAMQNNWFYNALIISKLNESYSLKKYLQLYKLFPPRKTMQKKQDNT